MTTLVGALLASLLAGAPDAGVELEFRTGVHLENHDERAYEVAVEEPLTTAICYVKTPTEAVKNGIASAASRKVAGFERIPSGAPNLSLLPKTRSRLAAGARVPCLCAKPCRVDIQGIGGVDARSGDTLVIKAGTLVVVRRGRASIAESWMRWRPRRAADILRG